MMVDQKGHDFTLLYMEGRYEHYLKVKAKHLDCSLLAGCCTCLKSLSLHVSGSTCAI